MFPAVLGLRNLHADNKNPVMAHEGESVRFVEIDQQQGSSVQIPYVNNDCPVGDPADVSLSTT